MDKLLKKGADWTIIIVLLAIALIVFFIVPARADMRQAKGLLCDTQEQIENWLTLFQNGTPGDQALELVNAGSNACGVLHVLTNDLEIVREGTHKGKPYAIYKMTVIGVMTPGGPVPVPGLVQYMAGPKQATKGNDA